MTHTTQRKADRPVRVFGTPGTTQRRVPSLLFSLINPTLAAADASTPEAHKHKKKPNEACPPFAKAPETEQRKTTNFSDNTHSALVKLCRKTRGPAFTGRRPPTRLRSVPQTPDGVSTGPGARQGSTGRQPARHLPCPRTPARTGMSLHVAVMRGPFPPPWGCQDTKGESGPSPRAQVLTEAEWGSWTSASTRTKPLPCPCQAAWEKVSYEGQNRRFK